MSVINLLYWPHTSMDFVCIYYQQCLLFSSNIFVGIGLISDYDNSTVSVTMSWNGADFVSIACPHMDDDYWQAPRYAMMDDAQMWQLLTTYDFMVWWMWIFCFITLCICAIRWHSVYSSYNVLHGLPREMLVIDKKHNFDLMRNFA